jgi:hypothetical protein
MGSSLSVGLRHFPGRSTCWSGSIRARNSSMPARPNMARLRVFNLLIWPWAWPLLRRKDKYPTFSAKGRLWTDSSGEPLSPQTPSPSPPPTADSWPCSGRSPRRTAGRAKAVGAQAHRGKDRPTADDNARQRAPCFISATGAVSTAEMRYDFPGGNRHASDRQMEANPEIC